MAALNLFKKRLLKYFNPFSTNVQLLYPLKISEDLRFSDIFREFRSGVLAENGLIYSISLITHSQI